MAVPVEHGCGGPNIQHNTIPKGSSCVGHLHKTAHNITAALTCSVAWQTELPLRHLWYAVSTLITPKNYVEAKVLSTQRGIGISKATDKTFPPHLRSPPPTQDARLGAQNCTQMPSMATRL